MNDKPPSELLVPCKLAQPPWLPMGRISGRACAPVSYGYSTEGYKVYSYQLLPDPLAMMNAATGSSLFDFSPFRGGGCGE